MKGSVGGNSRKFGEKDCKGEAAAYDSGGVPLRLVTGHLVLKKIISVPPQKSAKYSEKREGQFRGDRMLGFVERRSCSSMCLGGGGGVRKKKGVQGGENRGKH